jgi:hypothetical protein
MRYVTTAMPIASANLQQGELIGWPTGRWTRQADGQYHRQEAIRVSWDVAVHHREAQLHALPEYQDTVAFIKANAEWAGQFDNLVGTSMMRTRLDLAQFLDGCLADALAAPAEGRSPLEAAAARAARVEALLDSSHVEIETFAPLLGMHSFGLGPITLDGDMRIEPVDEAELERLFAVGLITSTFPHYPFYSPPSHTVRFTYRAKKGVGELEAARAIEDLDDPDKVAAERIEELVACLRIFQRGLVAVGGRASTMPQPFGGYQYHGPGSHPMFGGRMMPMFPNAYFLGEGDVPLLQALWRQMHSTGFRVSEQLALGTRRFAYRGERTRVDDQLVDLIVAAEALFLGDGDDESRGELRYRLSSRAAWYIADTGRSRLATFKLFMAAYKMRSRLVHGSDAKPMKVAGEELTPERMVEVLEGLLRLALKQAIDEAATGSGVWRVDWERLLFPQPPSLVLPDGPP